MLWIEIKDESTQDKLDEIHFMNLTAIQQLAKDAQSNGDPVLAQNYLQHADHYLRRYNELNDKRETSNDKTISDEKSLLKEENLKKENLITTN